MIILLIFQLMSCKEIRQKRNPVGVSNRAHNDINNIGYFHIRILAFLQISKPFSNYKKPTVHIVYTTQYNDVIYISMLFVVSTEF